MAQRATSSISDRDWETVSSPSLKVSPSRKVTATAPPGASEWETVQPSERTPRQAENQDGILTKGWNWLWKPLSIGNKDAWWNKPVIFTDQQRQKAENMLISTGNPTIAAAGEYAIDTGWRLADLVKQTTAPGSLALALFTLGDSVLGDALPQTAKMAASAFRTVAGISFAGQGVRTALAPRRQGESGTEYARRVMMGGGMGLLAGAGLADQVKEGVRNSLRKNFGLDEDLAGKVSDHVAKIAEAKADHAAAQDAEQRYSAKAAKVPEQLDEQEQNIAASLKAGMEQAEREASGRLGSLEQEIRTRGNELALEQTAAEAAKTRAGSRLVADSMQGVLQEQARVSEPFEEMAKKIKEPVAKSYDVRSMIENELDRAGARVEEAPRAAFSALPKPPEDIAVGATRSTSTGALFTKELIDEGDLSDEKIREILKERGYTPRQVEYFMSFAKQEGEEKDLHFGDLTRVRDDLYSAAASAKDAAVRNGLYNAASRLTDDQEKIAADNGMGAEYKKAKFEYLKFRRGIGSGLMSKLLDASDVHAQQMTRKISMMLNPVTGAAIESMFRAMGIDTSDFHDALKRIDDAVREEKELPKEAARRTKEIESERDERQKAMKSHAAEMVKKERESSKEISSQALAMAKQASEAAKEASKRAEEGEKAGSEIVKGKTTSEISGLNQRELEAQRIRATFNNVKNLGMANPWRLALAGIGLVRLAMGSMWGSFELALGAGPMAIGKLIRNEGFQNYVIKLAGAEDAPPEVQDKIRKGIEGLSPALRAIARTQLPSAVTRGGVNLPQ